MTAAQILFFQTFYPEAVKLEKKFGIPALAAMAQTILESGWGASKPGNMYFGMKATGKSYGGWDGVTKQLLRTTEILYTKTAKFPEIISIVYLGNGRYEYKVRDYFRAYKTAADSFTDYAGLLKTQSRYKAAFNHPNDPKLFATEVAKGGYATEPTYAARLHKVIDTLEYLKKKRQS
jgi:flagellar protein FlgJ